MVEGRGRVRWERGREKMRARESGELEYQNKGERKQLMGTGALGT